MIQEVIVTSMNQEGLVHIAPMGIHVLEDELVILPFKPSTTLDNIISLGVAVVNYCDDVRVFAGCLTGHRDWALQATDKITGKVLSNALAHSEVELIRVEDDAIRPKLFCKVVHTVMHKPFLGFNRGQYSVIEAAILCSRLKRLSLEKIETEIEYLRIGVEKTAGDREWEAWNWLMVLINQHKQEVKLK
ncbi:MAG: DUF447 family protein [Methylococcales bacterium]|nr:DUF447 family protein [Methylococcales bacterium]MCK5924740.1 DUF447 family protein [Methylococcales bacterium]